MLDLTKIGLTSGEIKVYSALLELGETTRTELAKVSGVSPSKIYDVANRLLEKGIISSVKINGVIHFKAANPSRINDFILKKQSELQTEMQLANQILPILMAKYDSAKTDTNIEVFHGWEGMKTVFNDIIISLEKGDFNYIFGASKGYNSKQADIFFNQYYLRKKQKGFGTKIIFNDNMRQNIERISIFNEAPNEMRFLHQDTFAEINLYKNTVLIILLIKSPIVIKITNQEAADSFFSFFNTMWDLAKV